MEILALPLYPTIDPKSKVSTIPRQILPTEISNPLAPLENILSSILPSQTEETNIIRTRRILDETAKSLSNEQVECIVAEFQFLINSWLDEYELDVFNGKTLKEVLNEG